MTEISNEDAIKFLEGACRNWSRVPPLSKDDVGDVAAELYRFVASRRASPSGVEVKGLVDYLWQELCELPDRTSPDEYPDMAMATLPEITAIVETFFERQALTPPHSITPEGGEPVAWEAWWEGAGSINSVTRVTRDKSTAARWEDDGAEITPLYAHPSPSPNGVTVSDEMVERGLSAYSEGGCMGLDERERREVVTDILLAALEGGSQT